MPWPQRSLPALTASEQPPAFRGLDSTRTSRTVNVLPLPNTLVMLMAPPIRSTSIRQSVRPRPVPGSASVSDERKNFRNRRA